MDISYYKKYEPIFGEYYIKREIGSGSYGIVLEIEREDLGKKYNAALKVVTIPQNKSEINTLMAQQKDPSKYCRAIVERFRTEVELMAELKGNSHIVSYENHKFIQHDDGIGWDILMQMEMLTPLYEHMLKKRMEEADIIELGIHICRALEVCQKHDIVHRDVKPENIFISKDGNYKLGDFGVAKISEETATGTVMGTKSYMAPEVFNHEAYGSSADIYSLGLVLYGLLNNHNLPFEKEDDTFEEKAIAKSKRLCGMPAPTPAKGSPALKAVVMKAVNAAPKDRFASAKEMGKALTEAAKAPNNAAVGAAPRKVDVTPKQEPVKRPTSVKAQATSKPKAPQTPPVQPKPKTKPQTPPKAKPQAVSKPASTGEKSGVNKKVIGGIAAAVIVAVAAFFIVTGGGSSSTVSSSGGSSSISSNTTNSVSSANIGISESAVNYEALKSVNTIVDNSSVESYMGIDWGYVPIGNLEIRCPVDCNINDYMYNEEGDNFKYVNTRYESGDDSINQYLRMSDYYSEYKSPEGYIEHYIKGIEKKESYEAAGFSGYLLYGDEFMFAYEDKYYALDMGIYNLEESEKKDMLDYIFSSIKKRESDTELATISGKVEFGNLYFQLSETAAITDFSVDYDDRGVFKELTVCLNDKAKVEFDWYHYDDIKDEFNKYWESSDDHVEVAGMKAYRSIIGDMSYRVYFIEDDGENEYMFYLNNEPITTSDSDFYNKILDSVEMK